MNRSEIVKNFGYMHMCLYIPFGFKTFLSDDTYKYNLIKQDSIETVTISKGPAQIMDHSISENFASTCNLKNFQMFNLNKTKQMGKIYVLKLIIKRSAITFILTWFKL